MTTTLVISAHPEPQSFTQAWAKSSANAARELGQNVLISDLYGMNFDPAERAELADVPGAFDPLKAQADFPARDAEAEAEKIEASQLLIFHFPIWWFGPPAILKGWCDRVLLHGRMHSVDQRFDKGLSRGKRAIFCVSTGASEAEVGPRGKEGRLDLILWPLAYTLRYCGFDVLDLVAVHGVHGYWEGKEKYELEQYLKGVLDGQKTLLSELDQRPFWPFHADTDFTPMGRLRDGVEPLWPFHS